MTRQENLNQINKSLDNLVAAVERGSEDDRMDAARDLVQAATHALHCAEQVLHGIPRSKREELALDKALAAVDAVEAAIPV